MNHPTSPSYINHPRDLLAYTANAKKSKHAADIRKAHDNAKFIPLVATTLGSFGSGATEFVRMMADHGERARLGAASDIAKKAWFTLSVALVRGVARALMGTSRCGCRGDSPRRHWEIGARASAGRRRSAQELLPRRHCLSAPMLTFAALSQCRHPLLC